MSSKFGMLPILAFGLISGVAFAASGAGSIRNGGFEAGLDDWRPLFTREPHTGRVTVERRDVHSGQGAARIEHTGQKDWSFDSAERLAVVAGDVFELQAWLKVEGAGSANLCVSTWDNHQQVVSWSWGAQAARTETGWQLVRCRFVAPDGVGQIQPRLTGNGAVVVWADDFSLEKKFNLAALRGSEFPASVRVRNAALEVSLNTADGTLAVADLRAKRQWSQQSLGQDLVLKKVAAAGDRIDLEFYHATTGLDVTARLQLDADRPEFTVTLAAEGEMPATLTFPQPFAGVPGDYLVVPMNEGISYPVDDPTISPMRLIAYGGHGICMAFWGLTDGAKGQMAILETPDDASIRIERLEQRLVIAPAWEAQRSQFGYARRVRYVFFSEGGHVAMAKRYRAYAKQIGLFKSLEEKRRFNPNVDRLLGAVNVWCWDKDAVAIVQELQAAGIRQILWSNRQDGDGIAAMNALGVLTSRYDIYQDVMDPANFPRLRGIHPDWTTAAWPKDIIVDRQGQWIKGWGVEAKDGTMLNCGVICDRRALDYARERVPADLATHPYLGRFIDTTTAAPWHECYDPAHPMTRTESKQWKMELLRYMSEDNRLVTGCETGHDAAVPYLHFLEGMMSLGPYRVPDSGRRMQQILNEVPERVAKFQVGQSYRLPLFELVFHDCVVSYWYWGDYSNKLPALWDKRDLFNVLYGVPPMFMFNRQFFEANQARFVQSYQNTCPLVRQVATAEMTDHRFLTPDRNVQQTRFANGIVVTVNFGAAAYTMPGGETVDPMQFRVSGSN
jgi:catechol 2,3-dioxygenase-like lactoylglutathione lyase family enzyme